MINRGVSMLIEDGDLVSHLSRKRTGSRLLDRILGDHPEGWVVVARAEQELWDWAECEELAIDSSTLRICTAVLDDGSVVIRDRVPEPDAVSDGPELI